MLGFYAESSLLHDNVAFVLCLDSLGNGDDLFLHVSRPPKPGTSQFSFVQELEQVRLDNNVKIGPLNLISEKYLMCFCCR